MLRVEIAPRVEAVLYSLPAEARNELVTRMVELGDNYLPEGVATLRYLVIDGKVWQTHLALGQAFVLV
jgi:mRNA-degrading endonuclease RelE of RelBE toxin-antitoxin system